MNQPIDAHLVIETPARRWAMLCHLAALSGFLFPVLGHVIPTFIIWLMKRDVYPFVNDQGKEALNFQLSVMIWCVCSLLGCLFLVRLVGVLILFVVVLLTVFWILVDLICVLVAAAKAREGRAFRYPFSFRFLK